MTEVLNARELNNIVWDVIKDSQSSDDFIGFINHARGTEIDFEKAYDLAEKYWGQPKTKSLFPHAVSKLEERAASGCTTSMLHLGIWHRMGYGVPIDSDKGLAWYKAGMELMDARCFMAYAIGISKSDPDTARHLFKRSTELGNKLAHAYWADLDKEHYMQHLAEGSKDDDPVGLYLYAYELLKRAEKPHETEHALDMMKRAAKEGSTQAAFHVGMIYYYGEHDKVADKTTAEYWYQKGIRRGDFGCYAALGAYLLAWMPERLEEGKRCLTRGAMLGDRIAQYYLGSHLMSKGTSDKERSAGLSWAIKSAEAGHNSAYYLLGQNFLNGTGVLANKELSVYWHKRGAEAGYMYSQCAYGLALVYGEGTKQDLDLAHNLFNAAHLQGSGWGSYLLGMSYHRGDGCEKDLSKAFEFFMEGAKREDTASTFNLATAYLYGEGTEKNIHAALKWFKKASDMGSSSATYYLALMFLTGNGVSADTEKGIELLKEASAGGSSTAMRELGLLYFNGESVTLNMELAKRWMGRAAVNADQVAIDWIKEHCPEKPEWLTNLIQASTKNLE